MIVRQSVHDVMQNRAISAEQALAYKSAQYVQLLTQWNTLVTRINALGGESFFNKQQNDNHQFTKEEISKLILLCHPDKHDGKVMAKELTQKLLQLRQR